MSNKAVLEEAIHKIEREIEADEAWISYIDGEVREQNDKYRSISARLDEIEAKIDDLIRVVEREVGR
jgi:peptidoglycan hydrolase CwlO-like protein